MWLFTTQGFFSVVHKPGDPEGILTIRARAADDLDRLRAACKEALPGNQTIGPTTREPGTDYPYRAKAWNHVVANWLWYETMRKLNYNNFKAAATASLGRDRVVAFHKVWEVMATQYNGDQRWARDVGTTRSTADAEMTKMLEAEVGKSGHRVRRSSGKRSGSSPGARSRPPSRRP